MIRGISFLSAFLMCLLMLGHLEGASAANAAAVGTSLLTSRTADQSTNAGFVQAVRYGHGGHHGYYRHRGGYGWRHHGYRHHRYGWRVSGTMAMAITHFILGRTIISPTIPIHITVTVATEAAAPIGAADARGIGVMGTAITTAACAIMAAGRL